MIPTETSLNERSPLRSKHKFISPSASEANSPIAIVGVYARRTYRRVDVGHVVARGYSRACRSIESPPANLGTSFSLRGLEIQIDATIGNGLSE